MNTTKFKTILFAIICSLSLFNCSKKDSEKKIFASLDASDTGIDFKNTLTETETFNYFTYSYIYMGGGVATGDINNDGLIDVFFTGNQVSNKLYLNKGNLKFEDITQKAGVGGDSRWYTGVTMADVNGDGFLDIYCSVAGLNGDKSNQLYMNNGNGTFTEKAKQYGIDDIGSSVQGTFFDYDKDGDLDLFVANYPMTKFSSPTFVYVQLMRNVKDEESGHLYRNDGEKFTNVTDEAGVRNYGLSLSATIGDLNNDSWPDIYVSNDFNSPDFMYLNNHDGTFKEVIKEATSHTAFYGMGVDISDFNNDGNLDVFQVDMDAKSNRRKKANMSSMNPQLYADIENAGFQFQYMHNCMQVNSGVTENGVPKFSNISRLTGTSSTDWSWGPLFADFDNDGYKDLYITNGTRREVNNNDYFHSLEEGHDEKKDLLKKSMAIPSEKVDNFMFKNDGNLKFEQKNEQWGIEFKGFSNGVTYADLDNDGDLEIITNNIDDYASVFENTSSKTSNYLTVKFKGNTKNTQGLGNRVYVKTGVQTQMQELTLTRGFQSSVAPELHFGLNKIKKIDEVKVVWTDGKTQVLRNVDANKTIVFKQQDAVLESAVKPIETKQLFETSTAIFPKFKHEENIYNDFDKQVLLPHKMSTFGPALAVGDVNKDGLDDYFIGGSMGLVGHLFLQTGAGFVEKPMKALEEDKMSEDMGATFFDADNDGDNDLYVVSGGYEFAYNSPFLQDRLYINNGKGDFTKAPVGTLPAMLSSGSKVYAADFDKDGKQDLLVLGRQVPGQYPSPATSYLLQNKSTTASPKFEVSKMQPSVFKNLGMATSAIITDYNNDTWMDMIIVGEWMPIRVFENTKTGFKEVSKPLGLADTTGWWWNIQQGDFDKDGDMDYVVGNNGLNYKYKATPRETFDIYFNDFDKDLNKDIVLSYYNEGNCYPVRGRGCSSQQIPGIKNKYKDYESFSEATLVDVYTEKSLKASLHYQVKSFSSIYLENKNGKFIIHQLPIEAQMSCINQILVDDYDKDGNLDLLIAGNMYNSEVETPRNDAGYGLFLKGDGKGKFKPLSPTQSGFFAPKDVKDMAFVKVKSQKNILIIKNNDYLQGIKVK
jgi:enediyne biosynthesis protein E4